MQHDHPLIKTRLPGISLLEVLIAGGILIMITSSTVVLARSNNRQQLLSQDRTQAVAFANEALEIIRNLRDTSYVDQQNNIFNDFLPPPPSTCRTTGCFNQELVWDNVNNQWQFEPDPTYETDGESLGEVIDVNISTGDISDNRSRAIAGPINQSCNSTTSGLLTFCRRITLFPVAYDDPINGNIGRYDPEPIDAIPPLISDENDSISGPDFTLNSLLNGSFKVIVDVSWQAFGSTHLVTASDTLTHWRWLD